jgi:hypothetical protein
MLALDHFDFYYKPLYGGGELWPSVRLGLLTPNKFIAVLNRFSVSFEVCPILLIIYNNRKFLCRQTGPFCKVLERWISPV